MSEDRRSILGMLANGTINADEAERLIAALERQPTPIASGTSTTAPMRVASKYLRVAIH